MDDEIRKRLRWVQLYEELRNAGVVDVCKIAPGLYQYTAIDDCKRYKVLRLYPRRAATNTLDFLDAVMEEMPFAFQRIQTDRGREFFAVKFQERLQEWGIKFRPIKPRSPI